MAYQMHSSDHCTVISVQHAMMHHDPTLVVDLFDAIDEAGTSRYILDLSGTTEIDASMLGFFLLFNGIAQKRGKGVAIVTGGSPTRDRLERLHIDTVMLVVDEMEQAGVGVPHLEPAAS